MSKKFTKEVNGIKYQGKLPVSAEDQFKMVQQAYLAEDPHATKQENLEADNKLWEMIKPHCNIVKGEDELLVGGKMQKGLTPLHIATLLSVYKDELIVPLFV